jgi:hypothetical protein
MLERAMWAPLAAVNLFLPVQRQVVIVFGNDDLGQQASSGDALVNDLWGHGCGHDGLAARTGVLATDVAVHEELGGFAVELFADLFADALQGVALGAGGRVDLVMVLNALQLAGQGLALGTGVWLLGLWSAGLIGSAVFALGLLNQQNLRLGIKELALCVQALAAFAKAPLLQTGQLKSEGLVFGLLEFELLCLVCGEAEQMRYQTTGVLRSAVLAQGVELLGINLFEHGGNFARACARAKEDFLL